MTAPIASSGKKITSIFLALLTMGFFIAGLGLWKKKEINAVAQVSKNFRRPPVAVTSIIVEPQVWQSSLEAVGSLGAAQGVMLCADLPGVVYKMPLGAGGTMVKAGDLLIQLDTRQEEAQLRSAEAKLVLAKSNLDRMLGLSQKNVVPKATLDDAQAQYDGALAAVDEIKVIIKRKTLYAPFDGMLGISPLNEGQYIQTGASMVPLNLLDVLSVSFALPQKDFSDIRLGQEIRVRAEGVPNHVFKGKISQVNSELDPATRNINLSGSIKNEGMLLRGGMFVSVEVMLPEKKNVIAVPESAINYAPYSNSVFVIQSMKGPDGASYQGVREQPVTLGARRGDQVEILSGLKAGEEVVTSGVFKLQPGCPVKVDNSVQPENEVAPKPVDS